MKIYVEGNYDRSETISINAKGDMKNAYISKRQYQSAKTRLGLIEGDYLRLAPVGDNDPGEVLVLDGDNPWAVIN